MSQLADVFSGNGFDQQEKAATSPFDRLPPHSIDAEMCLLASMTLDRDIVGEVVQRVERESFYLADHQIIFEALVHLWQGNRPIDAVILRDELAKRQLLEEIGGTAYIAELLGSELAGFSRQVAREVAFRATGSIETPVSEVDWSQVLDTVVTMLGPIRGEGAWSPCVARFEGHVVAFAPYRLTHLEDQCELSEAASISEATTFQPASESPRNDHGASSQRITRVLPRSPSMPPPPDPRGAVLVAAHVSGPGQKCHSTPA